ncbi:MULTISPECIES: serine hydrolase [unclassified Mesorhizobium]|uniref:serine hydrolase n=1 Tax=unclassified Mesorhizobium TaxID=325217 RepID=UPI0019278D16|nr:MULTISPECIES: serine hydrolase [unclassified Mesorhizobium]
MAASGNPPGTAPIIIVDMNPSGSRGFAGQRETEMHYSASLLKVAAMYAAFELRKAANELLADLQPSAADVFQALRSNFDPVIRDQRVPQLAALADSFLVPRYEQVFEFDPATGTVNFSLGFFTNLSNAIVEGNNVSAGQCIHGLGFGYLTKAVTEAGFFDPSAQNGIWLCGDFGNGFPPQRIACLNDTPVAQATSVREMARLYALLFDRSLVDGVSDEAMLNLLFQALLPPRLHLLLNRTVDVQFVTLHSKIGLGPLNNGTQVASEGAIIRENSTERFFVVVFQNLRFVNDASIVPMSRIVDETLASFLFA